MKRLIISIVTLILCNLSFASNNDELNAKILNKLKTHRSNSSALPEGKLLVIYGGKDISNTQMADNSVSGEILA